VARGLRRVLRRPQRRRVRLQGPDEERSPLWSVRPAVFRKPAAQEEGSAGVHPLCNDKVSPVRGAQYLTGYNLKAAMTEF